MNITLNIDDTVLSTAIKKGVDLLSDDELKTIAKQALLQAFLTCDNFKDLLVVEKPCNYFGRERSYELGPLASKMAEASIDGKEFSDIIGRMISELREHHREILMDALTKLLFNRIFQNNDFERCLREAMGRFVYESRIEAGSN